jgi:hypothetical protein
MTFDFYAWREHIHAKLGALAGRECVQCLTPHGGLDVTWQELASWAMSASAPIELIWLNCLLSNVRNKENDNFL